MARSNNNLNAILLVGLILVLGLAGFLWFQNNKLSGQIDTQKKEMLDIEKINTELEQDYQTALNSLEELRGSNEDLNSLIEQQKTELEAQKGKVASLLYAKKDLTAARTELENLKTQASIYVNEITKLRDENNQLVLANSVLIRSNKVLETENDSAKTVITSLDAANKELTEVRAQITSENEVLSKKVEIAEAVKINKISLEGFKINRSGKERERKRARSIDMLKTCFVTESNLITENSSENFKVRIIDPAGKTLYLENAGSGELTKKSDNTLVQYTVSKSIPYESRGTEACIDFTPNFELVNGNYLVEMYNKGYLVGQGEFLIK